jgi:SAM-dependent methyltransferase
MSTVLEIGSANVNGGLRDAKPDSATWIGVDLEPGPGVDVVVAPGQKLPFEDNSFDLVIASSVFEHDLKFWETISEIARVVKGEGFIYVNAPSNGAFHRYPYDAFRFYPDAGVAFLEIVNKYKPNAVLMESFIADRDPHGWRDCVAVISGGNSMPEKFIHSTEKVSNLWKLGVFQEETSNLDFASRGSAGETNDSLKFLIQMLRNSTKWFVRRLIQVFQPEQLGLGLRKQRKVDRGTNE